MAKASSRGTMATSKARRLWTGRVRTTPRMTSFSTSVRQRSTRISPAIQPDVWTKVLPSRKLNESLVNDATMGDPPLGRGVLVVVAAVRLDDLVDLDDRAQDGQDLDHRQLLGGLPVADQDHPRRQQGLDA